MAIPTNPARIINIVTTRTRIGHTRLIHDFLLNHDEQPTCHQCVAPLTIEHIILHYPKYQEKRHILHHPTNMPT